MSFYVYVHTRPDGRPFYVGKGSKVRARKLTHRNAYYMAIVAKYGAANIKIELTEAADENAAFEAERHLIKTLRAAGHRLANLTDGGEGISGFVQSQSQRDATARANARRVVTEETRRKLRDSMQGSDAQTKHRRALAESRRGKPSGAAPRRGKGYTFVKARGVWQAQIWIDGRSKWLGHHKTEADARAAYLAAVDARDKLRYGTSQMPRLTPETGAAPYGI